MANTPECLEPAAGQEAGALPLNPFLAVRYQFGMLLGAEDFDTADGYPRGKMRLHNAWLQGAGVVWGLDVVTPQVAPPRDTSLTGEVRVTAGLALDAAGHELYVEQDACVDVGAWYAQHKEEQAVKDVERVDAETGAVTLQLHVELSFASCLARQVPALSEPCDGAAGTSTAYSRTRELGRLRLLPGPAPDRDHSYPTLRYLFGLGPAPVEPSPHQADAVAAVRGGWADPAQFLAILRRCAVADAAALQAATLPPHEIRGWFAVADEMPPLALADLRDVTLAPQPGGAFKMTAATVDVNVRRVHVATSTIQELHCCAQLGRGGPPEPSATATLSTEGRATITLRSLGLPFEAASVGSGAFSVTQLSDQGWTAADIAEERVDPGDASGKTVVVVLHGAPPRGALLRFIARGTGATPLLCRDASGRRVPFRGDAGRGGAQAGSDFVIEWEVQ